jgi:S1-C subfamily serine protease
MLGQAACDRFAAARMATINLHRGNKPRLSKKRALAIAGGVLTLALMVSLSRSLIPKTDHVLAQNLFRGRVAKLSPSREEGEYTSVSQLIESVEPSIVQIETDCGMGSGFVLDDTGLIVTCNHCIENALSADVVFANGRRKPVLGTAKIARECDLAILVIEPSDSLVPLPLANKLPKKGEPIVALGSPAGLSFSQCEGSISGLRTVGELNKLRGDIRAARSPSLSPKTSLVQINAPTMPGNSGGPVVDLSGNVIGICSFGLIWHSQMYNFCISASEIRRVVTDLKIKVSPLWEPGYDPDTRTAIEELGRRANEPTTGVTKPFPN